MSGVSLVSDFSGLSRVQVLLRKAGERLADPKPLLTDIGAALVNSTRQRFDTQSGPDGRRWTPHSADTVISRLGGTKRVYTRKMRFRKGTQARMGNLRILFREGHLRNSITFRASRTGVEIGTNLAYGAIHQFGGKAGRGKTVSIPARPYLGLSAADEQMIEGLAQAYLREVLP